MTHLDAVFGANDALTPALAAALSREAERFTSAIYVINAGRRLQPDSLISLLAMDIRRGDAFAVEADGADEQQAAAAIRDFLAG